MKSQCDFGHGRRGAVLRAPAGKTRITIRIDDDILEWFKRQVHQAGGGSYQTLINDALRRVAESAQTKPEDTLRRVLREELARYGARAKAAPATGEGRAVHRRLNITLPEKTLQLLDRVASKADRNRFIAEAVSFFVQAKGRAPLRKRLREGAIRRADRDRQIAGEWLALDEEAWQHRAR